MRLTAFLLTGFFVAFVVGLRADLRRRKLSLSHSRGWTLLTALDVAGVNAIFGLAAALILASPNSRTPGSEGLLTSATFGIICCSASLLFLWAEGKRQVQLQRPPGIVAGECAVLFGFSYSLFLWLFCHPPSSALDRSSSMLVGAALPALTGVCLLAIVVPRFIRGREGHRILDRIAAQGEFTQPEWAAPTPECPFPEKWHMVDAQSAELEVLGLLKSIVTAVKPDLIVETGTFIGHSAIKMAEGLRDNGFGRVITIEYDQDIFAKARQNIDASGVSEWIECRNASSLETEVSGAIDILYSDSDTKIRESEVRKFLPQVKTGGLILVHDSSSQFKVVREAALRLEREGLLSVILLSTPRGLVIAQKREGRG
jgi:predicted O-methyltransferase YrrM